MLKLLSSLPPNHNISTCQQLTHAGQVQMPNQAYELPLTSSQEYGWRPRPLLPGSPMFQYRKTKCDVTDYAEAYAASMGGESPYMHANPAKAAAAK